MTRNCPLAYNSWAAAVINLRVHLWCPDGKDEEKSTEVDGATTVSSPVLGLGTIAGCSVVVAGGLGGSSGGTRLDTNSPAH